KKLTPPSLDPSTKSDDGAKTNSTTTATTAGAIGKLTALTSSSITVTGDRALTCTVGASSPGSGDFHVGDAVRIGCLNGALYYIVKATPAPTATTTSGATTAGGTGKLTALSADSLTVTGDRSLTCTIGASS